MRLPLLGLSTALILSWFASSTRAKNTGDASLSDDSSHASNFGPRDTTAEIEDDGKPDNVFSALEELAKEHRPRYPVVDIWFDELAEEQSKQQQLGPLPEGEMTDEVKALWAKERFCGPEAAESESLVNRQRKTRMQRLPYGMRIGSCINPGNIAITFDDGPNSATTNHVLDVLTQYNVAATFFLIGQACVSTPANTATVRRMQSLGVHQICSHTYTHPDLNTLNSSERYSQMQRTDAVLQNILGVSPTYMRPPYGNCDAGCLADMAALRFHVIVWDIDTSDYAHEDNITVAEDNFDRGTNGGPSGGGLPHPIALAHDIYYNTSYVLAEYMIQNAINRGYRPVTVGECLNDPMTHWYRTSC